MKTLHLAFAPIMALVSLTLTPASAFASRYSGVARFMEETFGRPGEIGMALMLSLLGLAFIYAAIKNPEWMHDDEDPGYLFQLLGDKGRRAAWLVIGLLVLNVTLPMLAPKSYDTPQQTMQQCGDPGTESFINDEGFCDCPEGFTWANEADETSVVCMAESYAPRGS